MIDPQFAKKSMLKSEYFIKTIGRKCIENEKAKIKLAQAAGLQEELKRKNLLRRNLFKSISDAKRFKKALRKETSYERVMREDSSKQESLGKIVDSLKDSTLPIDTKVHPIKDFPSSPPIDIKSLHTFIEKLHKTQEGVVPLLFASMWIQEHSYRLIMSSSNVRVKPIEDIKIIEDMYKVDSEQVYLSAPFSARTCLFLSELYLIHSREIEVANYWARYAEKLGLYYEAPEDYCKARALIAAGCLETDDIQNAIFILKRLEEEEFIERDRETLAMTKALLGIALKHKDPNGSIMNIEEAKKLKENLPPYEDKKALMILPIWQLNPSEE
jgi:hypothetical protein